LETAN